MRDGAAGRAAVTQDLLTFRDDDVILTTFRVSRAIIALPKKCRAAAAGTTDARRFSLQRRLSKRHPLASQILRMIKFTSAAVSYADANRPVAGNTVIRVRIQEAEIEHRPRRSRLSGSRRAG